MTKDEVLTEVMVGLGNVPTQTRNTIKIHFNDVLRYLVSSGVKPHLIDIKNDFIDESCIGVITRGVGDLWNYGNGDTKLSDYFYEGANQLRKDTNE